MEARLTSLALMFAPNKWASLFDNGMEQLWAGFRITLVAAGGGLAIALALGIVFGVLSSSHWRIARALSRAYVEFFQNTPLLLQVVFMGFGLPIIWPAAGAILTNVANTLMPWSTMGFLLIAGILGVGIYHGAYISEAVRAGIQSISKGQLEASLSQGMGYIQSMRYVVIPQALRVVLPPLTNQAVSLVKNTSVLMALGVYDLMLSAKSVGSKLYNPGPTFLMVMVMYFVICYPLAFLAKKLEDRAEVLG
jgi:putative glutamine transport system permease protein